MDCWNAGKRNFVLLRAHKHADAPYPLGLLRARCERPHSRAAKGDNTFSPSNMDCHATLPRGHATEETITHPVVLRCGISTRLMSLVGHLRNPPSRLLCQLPPAADMPHIEAMYARCH
jgi:hypothetical protein